ncbi:MAG: hypothetical protein RMH84_01250 [Sulfolobales archaeon]|nr:hypothetical protein [Sulfolobales archaeon]MCX8208037.1 hypothetical protein [Sulfolobales archaeon]MDW8010212.1 hypothetical protein [Sulfolobales archaeon]
MRIKLKARLMLCFSELPASVLARSLSPDDVPPKKFTLTSSSTNGCYVYEVGCGDCFSEDILTLGSVLNEVILLSDMIRKVVRAVGERKSF